MTDPDTISTYQAVADEYQERNADRTGVEGMVEGFLAAVEGATAGEGVIRFIAAPAPVHQSRRRPAELRQ